MHYVTILLFEDFMALAVVDLTKVVGQLNERVITVGDSLLASSFIGASANLRVETRPVSKRPYWAFPRAPCHHRQGCGRAALRQWWVQRAPARASARLRPVAS